MTRYRLLLSGLVACVLVSPSIVAQQNWTGTPADTFRVKVINGRDEAVPVIVREVALTNANDRPLKVALDPATKVQLDPASRVQIDPSTVIRARLEPRTWEYKVIRLPPAFQSEEAQQALNAEGNQGWELVGVVSTTSAGSMLALKRMK